MSLLNYKDYSEALEEGMKIMKRQEEEITELKSIIKELREFIDDVIPQCPAGIDHLEYLKYKADKVLEVD